MALGVFGPGSIYVTRTDVANATPYNIGFAQELSYDESAEVKQGFGQNQYPIFVASSTIKTSGKMKALAVSGLALNACFLGQTMVAGMIRVAEAEAGTVPASTPWTITVSNAAQFDTDLGVIWADTGLPLAKVASGPTTGQYAVSTSGVYTFATADAGKNVKITYAYKAASTGQTLKVTNRPIGTTPTFQLDYVTTFQTQTYGIRFFKCVGEKLARSHKLTDFMMPEVDFSYQATAAGQVYEMYMSEVS